MNIGATLMETTTTTAAAAAATTTVAGKELDQEGGELGQEDGAKKRLSLGLQNNLELRLGISVNNNNGFQEMDRSSSRRSFITSCQEGLVLQGNSGHEVGSGTGGGSKRSWLSETAAACGFVHPWSLAARQEKAALEQAHHKASVPSTSSLPRVAHSAQAQPVVGWPPVRTFRRNLAGSSQATKQEMESEKEAKKAKPLMDIEKVATNINNNHVQSKPTMFVKVNMEGYAVGRKIDLKAHDSYDSLSKSLQKMFQNFLSVNIQGIMTKENERVDAVKNNYILLYEDNEGDRMLVGDVPWEMFITSVKRLHIALDPRAMNDGEGMAEEQERN